MGVSSFEELMWHVGHNVVVVAYGQDEPINVAVECEDCNVVLLDFDKPEEPQFFREPEV